MIVSPNVAPEKLLFATEIIVLVSYNSRSIQEGRRRPGI